jgi:hypothetical protein
MSLTGLRNWTAIPVHGIKSLKHRKNSTLTASVLATLEQSTTEVIYRLPLCVSAKPREANRKKIRYSVARSMRSNTKKKQTTSNTISVYYYKKSKLSQLYGQKHEKVDHYRRSCGAVGAFAKLRKATVSFVMSVRSAKWDQFGSHWCSRNFILAYFSQICRENWSFIKTWQE